MRGNERGTDGRYQTDSQLDKVTPSEKGNRCWHRGLPKNFNKAKASGYCEQHAENMAEDTRASGQKTNPLLCIPRSSLFRPENSGNMNQSDCRNTTDDNETARITKDQRRHKSGRRMKGKRMTKKSGRSKSLMQKS